MPGLIPDNELAAIRATANSSFDEVAIVKRSTNPTATGLFGEALAGASTTQTLPARVAYPQGALLATLIERVGSVEVFIVTFAYDADIRIGDLVTVEGITMKVHTPIGAQSYNSANQYVCGRVN